MSQRTYAGTAEETATGLRFEYRSKHSWGKVYYSFDSRTWHASKRVAFLAAKEANQLQPEGMVRVMQDGQPDTFYARTVESV